MATNREKYINNASNEELAVVISRLKSICRNCPAYNECGKVPHSLCDSFEDYCKKGFLRWLSQEAELTVEEKEQQIVSKFRNATKEEQDAIYNYMIKTSKPTGINIFDIDNDKTADEMFEKLGYVKEYNEDLLITYWNEMFDMRITIYRNPFDKVKSFSYHKSQGQRSLASVITEAEDKAIHKKIEELKNGNK